MVLALVRDNVIVQLRLVDPETEDLGLINRNFQSTIDVTDWNPQPRIGWTLDERGNIIDPNTAVQVDFTKPVKITRLAFRNRFTAQEKGAIYTAAQSSLPLKIYLDDLALASFVDLSRADTIAGVNTLAYAGILTTERAHEILTTPPSLTEMYRE